MADINGVTITSNTGGPYAKFYITYSKSRVSNSQMRYTFKIQTSLHHSDAFLGTGHTLDCTITINGSSSSVTLKSRSESWRGVGPHSTDTVTVTCSSTTGNSNQTVRFYVNNAYGTAGETDNSSYTVTSSPLLYTSCGAPSNLRVSKSQAAPNESITLYWNAGSAGTNNSVTGYDIRWRYANGNWDYSKSVGNTTSASITLPSGEGQYIDFQIRTKGSAGSAYYSGYTTKEDMVRTYSRPTMNTCSVSQRYGTYTITWSAATAGINNPVKEYEIWYSYKTSSSGAWSDRTVIAYVNSSTRSYTWSGGTIGYYYRFSVVAIGTNYLYSETNKWSTGYQKENSYTSAIPPSVFTYEIVNQETGQTNPYPSQQIRLRWSGGNGGTRNGISITPLSYSIQYQINNGSWNILNNSISSSQNYYNYTILPETSYINFRIKIRSQGGSSFDSSYKALSSVITIGTAPAPSSESAKISITQPNRGTIEGKQLSLKVDSPFTSNSIYNKISSYNIFVCYSSSSSIEADISNYSFWKTIDSIDDIPSNGLIFNYAEWGLYYRFAMIAYGEYNGQSTPVFSNVLDVLAPEGIPAQSIIVSGSGVYVAEGESYEINGITYQTSVGEIMAIGGSGDFTIKPDGGTNLAKYQLEYSSNETFIGSELVDINIGDSYTLKTGDFNSGTFYYIQIWSYALGEDEHMETPLRLNEGLENNQNGLVNYVSRDYLSQKNKKNPIVQIKRAYNYTWEREDSRDNGLRLEDGELGVSYPSNGGTPILKLGDGKSLFKNLPSLSASSEIYKDNGIFPKNGNYEINTYTINFFENSDVNIKQMSIRYNSNEQAIEFFSE